MTKKKKPDPQAPSSGYDIGYGKPPAGGQFEKGVSGNPKGRPKGARNTLKTDAEKLVDLVRKEAAREITMGPDGDRMTMQQAAVRSTMVNAVKGKTQAQRHSTSLILMAEREAAARAEKLADGTFRTLQAGVELQAKLMEVEMNCQMSGRRYPAVLPKPEDVILDCEDAVVMLRFPFGAREIKAWNNYWAQKHHLLNELSLLKQDMEEASFNSATKQIFEGMFEGTEALLDVVQTILWKTWRVAPDDVSGPKRDMEDFLDQPAFGDAKTEQYNRMAYRMTKLRSSRRVVEQCVGKVTDENAEAQVVLSAFEAGKKMDDQGET